MIKLVFKLPMILPEEKLPGRLLFVGHGASCLGIAGAFGREDYVPWDVTGYWHGRWAGCAGRQRHLLFFAVQSIFSRCLTRTQGLTASMTFCPSTLSISRYLKLLPGF